MSGCKFPEHHTSGSGGGGWLLLAVAAVALAAVVVKAVLVVAAFITAHLWLILTPPAVLAAAVVACIAVRRGWRPRLRRPSLGWLRHVPRSVWAAARWHHLTRNLGLAAPNRHSKGKMLRPRAIVHPGRHGVVARVRTVPGSGREEFDEAAEHISNYWRVSRVSVSQPRPGRLLVRGMKRDPLLEQFGLEDALPGVFRDPATKVPISPASKSPFIAGGQQPPRRLYLGRDEHGADRYADLANCPGICLGGLPGAGKSTEITSWLAQLAPSPAVQFALADGKNAGEFDDFADRAYVMAGDDLDEVIDLLERQHGLMTDRLAAVRSVLGVKNAWHVGPSEAWPLAVTVLDECQSYLDLTAVKGDKQLEPKVRRCIFLTSSLIRRGRSVMMLTVPATQKPTTDSLPSSIRDNCPVSLCFGVKTLEAAAATLGTAIRDYPSYSPVSLADPAYAGCCTATLKTGQDPFTRLRGPWVGEDQAARVAAASAHLRRDPQVSLPVVVPDDASQLLTA